MTLFKFMKEKDLPKSAKNEKTLNRREFLKGGLTVAGILAAEAAISKPSKSFGKKILALAIDERKMQKKYNYPFSHSEDTESLFNRIKPLEGYERPKTNSDFGNWLRFLPLKPEDEDVHKYNGEETTLKESFFMKNAGVIDMGVLNKWQQCADSILRLKAEYHWSKGEFYKIVFPLEKQNISYLSWIKKYDHSRKTFYKYLTHIYGNLGTASMKRDFKKINAHKLDIGDMNVQNKTGGVGHIFLILDIIENKKGKRLYLLGQGATPAQEFHIIQPPFQFSPWIDMNNLQNMLKTFSPYGDGVFRRF